MADLFLFSSMPVMVRQIGIIGDAMLNSNTGRRFAGNFAFDGLSGIATALKDFKFGVDPDCKACFSCKFPEMRLIFMLIATTTSIVSPDYFGEFEG
jgi:hypothetical protein